MKRMTLREFCSTWDGQVRSLRTWLRCCRREAAKTIDKDNRQYYLEQATMYARILKEYV